MRPTICEAVEKAAASLDHTGVRALRVLLHAGVSAYWPQIKQAPYQQIRAYESTVKTIRERWEVSSECVPDPVAATTFHRMDAEIVTFLELCADLSGTARAGRRDRRLLRVHVAGHDAALAGLL